MKRLSLLVPATAALLLAGSVRVEAQSQSPPTPWTDVGSELIATGQDVWVKFFGWDAAYTNDLFFICDLTSSCEQFLFENQNPGAIDGEVKIATNFAVGQEVLFKMVVQNTGQTYYSGSGARNPDGQEHFATESISDQTQNATYTTLGGFEDVYGNSDHDYNDLMFEVSDVKVTSTPEPASMTLFATGLFGLTGFARRRRKSNET